MTDPRLDDFIRSTLPSPEISAARMQDLTSAVFARIDRAPARRSRWWSIPRWPVLRRYALPMVLAAIFGGLVGAELPDTESTTTTTVSTTGEAPLSLLITASRPSQPLGF